MKKSVTLCFFVFSFSTLFGQNLPNDCVNYIQACDNQSISYDVSGSGVQEIIPQSCSSEEHNSLWLRVTIAQSGTLGFTLKPTSSAISEDYDFWVFGPTPDCNNLSAPIRCSTTNPEAANLHSNYTGMNASSTDTSEGPAQDGNSFVMHLNVLVGESYFIVIDRPIGNSSFTLNWTGTAVISNPFSTQSFNEFDDVVFCDDGADNLEPYDFSILTPSYLGSLTNYTLAYFQSIQDASLNNNEIVGTNNVSPGIYYARITETNSLCFIVKPINVVFNSLQPLQIFGCDETTTGIFSFDTSNLEEDLLNGLTGYDLTYTDQNNNSLSSPLPNPYTTSTQTINVTLTSNSGTPCVFSTTIDFTVNDKPQFFSIPTNLTTSCNQNDPQQQIETSNFDTSSFQTIILGGQTNRIIEYYDENNVLLSTPLPNPFNTENQMIFVKVIHKDDSDCFATGVINFEVLPLPSIELIGEEKFVCENLPNYQVTLNAGLLNPNQVLDYTYQWSLNNVPITGANSYTLQVNEAGNYSVAVTNTNNCTNVRTILVSESNLSSIP